MERQKELEKFVIAEEAYDPPLTLDRIIKFAARQHPTSEVVYRDIGRETYAKAWERIQRLANALESLEIKPNSLTRVGTADWNSHRYFEMYFGIPCMGNVMHSVNQLLPPEQILWTINHAEDKVLIFHKDLIPLIEKLSPEFKTVEKYVVCTDDGVLPETKLKPVYEYDELLKEASPKYDFPRLDERTPAGLNYTTGTTGLPKGCWFSHRAIVLHTINGACGLLHWTPEPTDLRFSIIFVLTPMFHSFAWGIPYIAAATGLKLLLHGRHDPVVAMDMVKRERIPANRPVFMAGVPRLLMELVYHPKFEEYKEYFKDVTYIVGGSSLPEGLLRKAEEVGLRPTSGMGMTETCPAMIGTRYKYYMFDWPEEKKLEFRLRTGWNDSPLAEVTVTNLENMEEEVPKDNKTFGEMLYRSPWCTLGYFKDPERSKELWRGGWLHTDDLCIWDEDRCIFIIDRTKDVIKSGGEWISTTTLESAISAHPKVKEAAVVGAPHPEWDERPIALVVPAEEYKGKVTEEELKEHLMKRVEAGEILKWWIPDKFFFVEKVPITSAGKINKKLIRSEYKDVFQ
ncbi:MAG: long-chain-fatty-acid--CoA ligase [Candidatus Freyrarchaeum guaymaensis]